MRKKGLIFLIILFAVLFLLTFLLTDRWLENRLEEVGSVVWGSKVEFDGVDFGLSDLHMKWDRLQVTNPNNTWHNLFETGPVAFRLQWEPLLEKKIMVEGLVVESLALNTRRKTDGALPKVSENTPFYIKLLQREMEKRKVHLPVLDFGQYTQKINLDSLWALVDLHTPDKADSLQKALLAAYNAWEERLNDLPTEKDLQRLRAEIESIKPDQINTVAEFQEALNKSKAVFQEVDSISREFKKIKKNFQADLKDLTATPQQISRWIQQDYQRVLSLAKLPDISVKNVGMTMFGNYILSRLQGVSSMVGKARYYVEKVQATQPKKENPPRLAGQDILFSTRRSWPDFLFKTISVNGNILNDVHVEGKIENVVSDQRFTGNPTTFRITGTRSDQASLELTGSLNYLQVVPVEDFRIVVQQMPLKSIKLSEISLLPSEIESGIAELTAGIHFKGSDFQSEINFEGSQLQIKYNEAAADMNAKVAEILQSILSGINRLTVTAKADRSEGDLNFSVSSNLDKIIAERVKGLVSEEIQRAKEKLEQRVRQEVDKYKKQLEQLAAEKEKELQAELNNVDQKIQQQIQTIENKRNELEKRIEQEKNEFQKGLEEKAKDRLKDIFK
ncbi:MAG: TIGR03545 family protein [Calditrichia bacterium]